jgi:hypothetical protein
MRSASDQPCDILQTAGALQWQTTQVCNGPQRLNIDAGHWPAGLYNILIRIGKEQQAVKMLVER